MMDHNLDAAMYRVALGGNWVPWTASQPDAGREAMADAALRYEAYAVDDGENGGQRLDPHELRWWRHGDL